MATLIDEKGLQHYADKMVKAENRKVGTKSLPTALTEIDAMIDSMKGKFDQAYGDALEGSFNNTEINFKVGSGKDADRSNTVENGFISFDKIEGNTLINRFRNNRTGFTNIVPLDEMAIKPDTDYIFSSSKIDRSNKVNFKQPSFQKVVVDRGYILPQNIERFEPIRINQIQGKGGINYFNPASQPHILTGSPVFKSGLDLDSLEKDGSKYIVQSPGSCSFRFLNCIPYNGIFSVSMYARIAKGSNVSLGLDLCDKSNSESITVSPRWQLIKFENINVDNQTDSVYNFLDLNISSNSGEAIIEIAKIMINSGATCHDWVQPLSKDKSNCIPYTGIKSTNLLIEPRTFWQNHVYVTGTRLKIDAGYNYTNFIVPVKKNTKYKVSYTWKHNSAQCRSDVILYKTKPVLNITAGNAARTEDCIKDGNNISFTFNTAEHSHAFLYLGWGSKGQALEEMMSNIVLEEVSETPRYIYYTGLTSYGKNLLNMYTLESQNPSSLVAFNGNEVSITGKGANNVWLPKSKVINVEKLSQATFSCDIVSGSGNVVCDISNEAGGSIYINYDYRGDDIVLDLSNCKTIQLKIGKHFSERADVKISNLQIEAGNKATEYSKFEQNSEGFILTEPLYQSQDSRYSDSVYWDATRNKYCIKRYVEKIVLDHNTKNIVEYPDVPSFKVRGFYLSGPGSVWRAGLGMNDYSTNDKMSFPGKIQEDAVGVEYSQNYQKFTVRRADIKSTIQDYLKTNPITFYRILVEPQIIELEQSPKLECPITENGSYVGIAKNEIMDTEMAVTKTVRGKSGTLRTPSTLENVYLDLRQLSANTIEDLVLIEDTGRGKHKRYFSKTLAVGDATDEKNLFNPKTDYSGYWIGGDGEPIGSHEGQAKWSILISVESGKRYKLAYSNNVNTQTYSFLDSNNKCLYSSGGQTTEIAPVGTVKLLWYLNSVASLDSFSDSNIKVVSSGDFGTENNKVEGFIASNVNLIPDTKKPENWKKVHPELISNYVENGKVEGVKFAASISDSDTNSPYVDLPKNMPLKPNTTYTLSFDIKCNGKNRLWIGWYRNRGGGYYHTLANYTDNTRPSFMKETYKFSTGSTIEHNSYISIWSYPAADTKKRVDMFIKNIKLEEGNIATDWSPCPLDKEYDGERFTIPLAGRLHGNEIIQDQLNGDTITRHWKELVVDGSYVAHITENTYVNDISCSVLLNLKKEDTPFVRGTGQVMCDCFPTYPSSKSIWERTNVYEGVSPVNTSWDFCLRINNSRTGILPNEPVASQKQKMIAYLNNNPVTIFYQMAQPKIEKIDKLTTATANRGESIIFNSSLETASTHTVALNKPGQILKNIEELTILRDRVKKLEDNYDQLALEQSHQLALTKQSIELDYEL